MIRRPPRSTLFPYTTPLPICFADDKDARTPTIAQDDDLDGLVELMEGLETYGPIQLNLTLNPEDSQHDHGDRKSTRLNSSHANISYAVFCLKKKNCISFPSTS